MQQQLTQAIEDLQQGKMVLLVDDHDRENEGDLVMAAEFASAEQINFMINLLCLLFTLWLLHSAALFCWYIGR